MARGPPRRERERERESDLREKTFTFSSFFTRPSSGGPLDPQIPSYTDQLTHRHKTQFVFPSRVSVLFFKREGRRG